MKGYRGCTRKLQMEVKCCNDCPAPTSSLRRRGIVANLKLHKLRSTLHAFQCSTHRQETMVVSKRISYWTVAEVFEWVREQYPSQSKALQQAIAKHAISGRVLLRMKKEQLSRLGIESKLQQEFLRDVLLLRIQEELENLNNIYY
uniref:SAM domain-containing protein n=1 Tax=Pygocentrus nattereri TaxID=42514 RepID=A0AAR2KEX1_PYGNA